MNPTGPAPLFTQVILERVCWCGLLLPPAPGWLSRIGVLLAPHFGMTVSNLKCLVVKSPYGTIIVTCLLQLYCLCKCWLDQMLVYCFTIENFNWRIFSLTTSQSLKLILKADLKWECPCFNSKFFLERFDHKINSKMDFSLYFKMFLGQWEGVILEIPYGSFKVFSPFYLKIT